jgi:hydroxymethylglutaryl-CoA lyase
VTKWSERLSKDLGISILALSDTIGVSAPENIRPLFETCIRELPQVEFGAHLHTTPETWEEKVEAAYSAGCRRFDGALKGFGGCPMAKDDLTGNMPTEKIISWLKGQEIEFGLVEEKLEDCLLLSQEIFG